MDTELALSLAVVTSRHAALIERWKCDVAGTNQSWFLWKERVKNFRSIRRGLQVVVQEIRDNRFGIADRGSSLETVVHSIPVLVRAVRALDVQNIKGLGPACANLLYFLPPTIVPPSDTAIIKGYSLLTGSNVKLGCWPDYLAMRQCMRLLNAQHHTLLSNGMGAIAGWQGALAQVRAQNMAWVKSLAMAQESDHTHTGIQGWLRDLGKAVGYDGWVANINKSRLYLGAHLSKGCRAHLPDAIRASEAMDTVSFFLVAPDVREQDVRVQIARPAFSRVSTLDVRYLGYSQLRQLKESIARFGRGLKGMVAISACLSCQINGVN